MTKARIDRIRATLESVFEPLALEIRDDSHLHAGHAGAKDGKGHFYVHIVSDRFQNKTPIVRHRMIFEALEELMTTDIHALSVSAKTPASNQTSSH